MSADLVGTTLDGKFQIERALASGAAGDVYEAMHLGLGTRVAVKVLRPGVEETASIRRKRFLREARVAARLRSDHVVRVYDVVAPDEGPTYIVMELLRGETLADRLKRDGALAPADAVDFVLQAAKPLAEMHDEGIVHRDVKPSNLFLARDADGKERIKLLDFGVAAFQQPLARAESSLTFSQAVLGTPKYMAPEQVRASSQVDARADVWALGVTLHELVTGTPPFDGQTVLAVLNQIEHQEPPPLGEGVPRALGDIVRACLAKDPAGRPASARALASQLESAMARRPRRRDPRVLVASVVGAAAVATLTGILVHKAAEAPAEAATTAETSAPVPTPLPTPVPTPVPTPTPAPMPTPTPVPPVRHASPRSSASPRSGSVRPAARPAPEDDDRLE